VGFTGTGTTSLAQEQTRVLFQFQAAPEPQPEAVHCTAIDRSRCRGVVAAVSLPLLATSGSLGTTSDKKFLFFNPKQVRRREFIPRPHVRTVQRDSERMMRFHR